MSKITMFLLAALMAFMVDAGTAAPLEANAPTTVQQLPPRPPRPRAPRIRVRLPRHPRPRGPRAPRRLKLRLPPPPPHP